MWIASAWDIGSAFTVKQSTLYYTCVHTYVCAMSLYAIYDECTTIYGHKNCLSYWQASWLPFAIYFALCCQGFCAQTQVHLPSRSHSSPLCLAHTCALPVAAYSGVQLANATPASTAAAAHDKSLFIISIVIEQFPLVVPWIFPSARKLLPKWQSQQNPHKLNWQLTGQYKYFNLVRKYENLSIVLKAVNKV